MTITRRDFLKSGPAALAAAQLPVQNARGVNCGYGSGSYGAGVYGGACATPTSIVTTEQARALPDQAAIINPVFAGLMLLGATLIVLRQRLQQPTSP